MIASIRQLRSSTKEILNAVGRGDTVWVTSWGKTLAKIIPAGRTRKTEIKDEAFGMWRNEKESKDVRAYIRKMRAWGRAV